MKKTIQSIIVGCMFIGIGIGYFGRALGIWQFTLFFPGWWAAAILMITLFHMISHGIHVTNAYFAITAGFFLLGANGFISFAFTLPIILAIICFYIGLKCFFRKEVTYHECKFF